LPVRKSQVAAWDKRCRAGNVYLDQETGRKMASCRFNSAFSVWVALGHIQWMTSRETAPRHGADASAVLPRGFVHYDIFVYFHSEKSE
jgi:hypothetical protein